ncbi:ABC transporter permease [Isoptericola sp. b490]|uniref:ABC transporter permease n=1 Tax=Actinotalea lenta TaxID=3064654 RepID=UPI002712D6E4|nr:ABC transporter permease [Isoptericola sp. b490]MDO8121143.1 ABC transporter permease [Isoptericola sp. b490]
MTRLWWRGLLRRRRGRLAGAVIGTATAVALLAALGMFLATSKASMTARAASGVGVDWQVQVAQGADPAQVAAAVAAEPGTIATEVVGFATTTGLSATTGGTTQTTGPGVVVGLPAGYAATFPAELRTLTGDGTGVLLAQQTAANLHAGAGDTVSIGLAGQSPVDVTVAGVVDLPQADSFFQTVGAPAGSGPTAPPDNVILLPADQFATATAGLASTRPDLVTAQVHAARSHALPADPAAAYVAASGAAHHMDVTLAGAGQVGDNLGATLDAARSDALYAQALFLFLGTPGAVLAGLLTATLTATGATRRRRDQALLRSRGASTTALTRLAAVEAGAVAVGGGLVGLALAAVVGRIAFGAWGFGASALTWLAWTATALGVGALVAALTVLVPARRDATRTVAAGRRSVGREPRPWWLRWWLDLWLLAGAGVVLWLTRGDTYHLVLAPEGVSQLSVSYWVFAGPALLWLGSGLLTWRLADALLTRGRPVVAAAARPFAGPMADTVAASLSRQRRPVARAVVLLALALSFAASTATFNATYRQQAEVDAQLTNGGDVTVTEPPGSTVTADAAAQLAAVPGVRAAEPLLHRYAYVGSDLQDLYGVQPGSIGTAVHLQDSWFQGGTAPQLMSDLAASPDNILVSAETVKDFQLHPGDTLKLRLPDANGSLVTVPFVYAGVATEFPTAPKDSFLVANADYVAAQTHNPAVGAFLLDTGGVNQAQVADAVRATVGTGPQVTAVTSTRAVIGSSLTAVDLAGLTRVELAFAVALAVAAGGLVLALALAERRRTFALASAQGASPRQLRAMVGAEAGFVAVAGGLAGAVSGWALSLMLVRVLTGVFDPPPDHLAVPWPYLAATAGITAAAILAANAGFAAWVAGRPVIAEIKEL